MARYGTFLYGTTLYGIGGTEAVPAIAVDIDWVGDGQFHDESMQVKLLTIRRGKNSSIGANEYTSNPSGTLNITLNNNSRRYEFYYDASAISDYLLPNRRVRIRVSDGTNTYILFVGSIYDMIPQSVDKLMRIEARDGIDFLTETPAGLNSLQTDYAVSDAISDLLGDAGWAYSDTTGWTFTTTLGIDSILGSSVIENNGDEMPYWWSDNNKSTMAAINDLASAFAGHAFVANDGTFSYNARDYGNESKFTLTDDDINFDSELRQPWDEIRNTIRIVGHPRIIQGITDIWTLGDIPVIGAGSTLTLWADFECEGRSAPATAITEPASTTDYTANTQADGLGVDKTAQIDISMTEYAATAKLTITNNDAADVYLTLMKLRGTLAMDSNPITVLEEDSDSQDDYGKRRFYLDTDWLQTASEIGYHAANALASYKDTRRILWVSIYNNPAYQFGADLYDQISIDSTEWNIDADYIITYIEHEYKRGKIKTTMRLEPVGAASNYWIFTTELGETSILGW
jgi:hypothetical protein